MIYFTLLHCIPIATVSGYVRCAHVALAMPLSMLAYLPQSQRKCRRSSRQAGAAETATQSQMQVEIRSMRAVRFGDSKKLVVHTWPARPPTRSYQSCATCPSTCPRQSLQLDVDVDYPLPDSHGHAYLGSTKPCAGASFGSFCSPLLVLMRIRS